MLPPAPSPKAYGIPCSIGCRQTTGLGPRSPSVWSTVSQSLRQRCITGSARNSLHGKKKKKEKESVNLIAEEWNHKTVSWVGSVATQSQMGEQTIVKVIPVPFLNPRASKKQLDKNSFSHAIRPCLVPLMLQWQYKSKTFYLVSLVV